MSIMLSGEPGTAHGYRLGREPARDYRRPGRTPRRNIGPEPVVLPA